jgi:hypothetical protein
MIVGCSSKVAGAPAASLATAAPPTRLIESGASGAALRGNSPIRGGFSTAASVRLAALAVVGRMKVRTPTTRPRTASSTRGPSAAPSARRTVSAAPAVSPADEFIGGEKSDDKAASIEAVRSSD